MQLQSKMTPVAWSFFALTWPQTNRIFLKMSSSVTMKTLIIYRSTVTHSITLYIIIALNYFDLNLDESRFINIGEFIPGLLDQI